MPYEVSFTGWMASMDSALTASRWDDEYRNRRYEDDAPLPFVDTIMTVLTAHPLARAGHGLYVGCGNGRNYLPLVDAGLNLAGLDVSPEAIRRLGERRPVLRERLRCADFCALPGAGARLDYLIAIQVFQHGNEADVARYFEKVASLLQPGGLFFLRVNSVTTEIYHAHSVVERNACGGFTIRYDDGPKRGLLVHFYSRAELTERLRGAFSPILDIHEDVAVRAAPKTGSWAQWEAVYTRGGSP
jgi:SAM-dependent methyltransferase